MWRETALCAPKELYGYTSVGLCQNNYTANIRRSDLFHVNRLNILVKQQHE